MNSALKKIKDRLQNGNTGVLFAVLTVYLLLFFSNLINRYLLGNGNTFIVVFLIFSMIIPAFFWFFIRGNKQYIPSLRLNPPRRTHLLPMLFAFVILACGGTLLDMIFSGEYYINFSIYNTFIADSNGEFFSVLYTVVAFVLIPSITEEFMFRGILCAELESSGTLCSVLSSALFFSLLSLDPQRVPLGFFVGALLGIVLYATDSLPCVIILRVCYSLFALFVQPMLVSFKDISANLELFVFILIAIAIVFAILLTSRLSKLYLERSRENESSDHTRSVPRGRIPHALAEILLSPPAIACYSVFIITSILLCYIL